MNDMPATPTNTRNATPVAATPFALVDAITLALLILAICTQWDLAHVGRETFKTQGFVTKQLAVSLPDLALALAFVWFLASTTLARAWRRVWWPPLPVWALIAALCIAALHAQTVVNPVAGALHNGFSPRALLTKESKEAIAEIVQWTGYFILAPWLFVNLIHDRRSGALVSRRSFALLTFALAVFAVTVVGLLQTVLAPAQVPEGTFNSPNIYGAFLAVALPLLVARRLHEWRGSTWQWIGVFAAVLLAVFTVASAWAVAALFLGVLVAGWLLLVPDRLAVVLGVLALLTALVWLAPMPQGSVAGQTMQSARQEFLRVSSPTEAVKKQYVEWYVALGWANPMQRVSSPEGPERLRAFATGVGPGNYQGNIGTFYQAGSLPNEEKMPPDSNNLFLVQAVSIGFLGLGALLWTLFYFARQAWVAQRRFPLDWLGAGVLGSMTAWCFVNLFHAMIVRGTGLILAFLFALAIAAIQMDED
jgi:hypothetical protein